MTTRHAQRRELAELDPVVAAWTYMPPPSSATQRAWDEAGSSLVDGNISTASTRRPSVSGSAEVVPGPAIVRSTSSTIGAGGSTSSTSTGNVAAPPRRPDMVQRTVSSILFWRKDDAASSSGSSGNLVAPTASSASGSASAGALPLAAGAASRRTADDTDGAWVRLPGASRRPARPARAGYVDVQAGLLPFAQERIVPPPPIGGLVRAATSAVLAVGDGVQGTAAGGNDGDDDDDDDDDGEDPDEVLAALPLPKQLLRCVRWL